MTSAGCASSIPHAHLQSDAFAKDADEVLAAARAAGVERVLVPAWDLASSRDGLAFARRHGLPAAVGIHPHVAGRGRRGHVGGALRACHATRGRGHR